MVQELLSEPHHLYNVTWAMESNRLFNSVSYFEPPGAQEQTVQSATRDWVVERLFPVAREVLRERPGCDMMDELFGKWAKLAHQEIPQETDDDVKEYIKHIQGMVNTYIWVVSASRLPSTWSNS